MSNFLGKFSQTPFFVQNINTSRFSEKVTPVRTLSYLCDFQKLAKIDKFGQSGRPADNNGGAVGVLRPIGSDWLHRNFLIWMLPQWFSCRIARFFLVQHTKI
jgi:hypothetical protein